MYEQETALQDAAGREEVIEQDAPLGREGGNNRTRCCSSEGGSNRTRCSTREGGRK